MAEAYGLVVALLFFAPVATGSRAHPPGRPRLSFPTQATVDGCFAHYLRSLDGRIQGLVLEDGAVARLARGHRLVSPPLRKGDRVRVQGDVVAGLPGPFLVRATVKPWPGLVSGIALRPPERWPGGLQALAVPDALFVEEEAEAWDEGVQSAQLEPSQLAKVARWLRYATTADHPTDPRFARRQEDEGP